MQGFKLTQFLWKRIPSGEPLQGGVAAGGLGMKIEEGTPHATAEGVEPVRSGANELVATGNRFLPLRGTKATVKYHVCEQKVFSALRALAQLPTLLRVCG